MHIQTLKHTHKRSVHTHTEIQVKNVIILYYFKSCRHKNKIKGSAVNVYPLLPQAMSLSLNKINCCDPFKNEKEQPLHIQRYSEI